MKKERLFSPETPLGKFETAVREAWCRETAHPEYQAGWSEDNPAAGQCAVTLLLLADYLPGGRFLKSTQHYHYAYEINGEVIDLTREQFGDDAEIVFDTTSDRERLLNSPGAIKAQTPERYMLLAHKVAEVLGDPDVFWLHQELAHNGSK